MFERAPANIRVSNPIGNGVIADIRNMELLMKSFMRDEQRGTLHPADFFVAVPTDVTEVERRAFYDLIEDAGLKGFSVGGAAVSEKHAGFVINKDHGTAADILELCNEVKRRVKENSGVDLEMEVKLLGDF